MIDNILKGIAGLLVLIVGIPFMIIFLVVYVCLLAFLFIMWCFGRPIEIKTNDMIIKWFKYQSKSDSSGT
ncbi:Uncharacterised protein [uncultured archaeon]|nr:Uncharacterised protein [uncultured archaeon]